MTVMSNLKRYGLATIFCALALAIAWPLDAPSSCFFLAIMASSLYGGRGPGLLSIALSCLAFDYFFLPPQFHFLPEPSSYLRFGVFLGAALLVSQLIEAKRRSEESRRRADAQHRVVVETAPDAIISINDRDEVLFVNPAAARTFGRTVSELIGQPLTRLMPQFRREERTDATEQLGLRSDDTQFPVEVSFSEASTGTGSTFTGFVRDITEKRRAEDALRKSESYLTEAQRLSQTGSFGLKLSTGELFWSDETYRILGYELVTKPTLGLVFERIHPEDRAWVQKALDLSSQRGSDLDFEHRLLMPDGSVKYLHVLAHAMKDASGNLEYFGAAMDITARRRAEEELRNSEEKYRDLVNLGLDAIYLIDHDGNIVSANPAGVELWGGEADDLRCLPLADTYLPEERDIQQARLEQLRAGDRLRFDRTFVRKDGSSVPVEITASPMQHGYCQAVIRDISERKRAEEKLRTSEQTFRLIVDSVPGLVATMTAAGEVELVNQRILDYVGKSLEELKNWAPLIHPDYRERVIALWSHSVKTGEPYEVEHRLLGADGGYRWFQTRGLAVRDTEGRILRWYILLTDIEDRKRADEALRASEQSFRLMVDSIPGFVFINSADGKLEYVNQRILDYSGKTLADLADLRWTSVIHPADVEPAFRAWLQSVATGIPHEAEWRFLRADGTYRWFHNRVEPLRDNEGRITRWYGLLQDVDDQKNAEDALRTSQTELAHLTRVMTMGEMVASIAHEVNQPLSGVVLNGNACLRWLAGDPPNLQEAREAVQRIVRDGKRAGDVIAKIRALTTKKATSKEPLDLNEAVQDVMALADGQIRRNRVVLRMELSEQLPMVFGDRVQLQQVVLNLVMNGIDAMNTTEEALRELTIKTQNGEPGQVQVTVQDSGVGLSPQTAHRIFDAFYTTKPDGMGMGLAISRSIVENHGGRLWALMNQGPGATFQFTVPRYR